ncbi:MAG: T9SS type A sorting domain-containing protein [bacterium]
MKRLYQLGLSIIIVMFFASIPKESTRDRDYHGEFYARESESEDGKEREEAKRDAPDEFFKYHHDIRTAENEREPSYGMNYKIVELEKALGNRAALLGKRTALQWTERGPGNVGGRTRGLLVDPDDPTKNTWFAGSVGGGIWKTTTGGQSIPNGGPAWVNKTPNIPNLSTVSLAMAASNHSVIYAGTGEGFGNTDAIRGDGIWKSTDRGETWTQLPSTVNTSDFWYVNRLVVNPANQNIVVAATNTGLFRTTDGGSSWTRVWAATSRVQQVIDNPLNGNTLYAAQNAYGVLKSYDGGNTWAKEHTTSLTGSRIEIALSPTDTSRLYATVEVSSTACDLYVSDNGGSTWIKSSQTSPSTTINWLGSQGWYDNTLVVNPYDKDILFVGGIDIYRVQISSITGSSTVIESIDTVGTGSFIGFYQYAGMISINGIPIADWVTSFADNATNVLPSDIVSVEIRFGPGKSQKAHRFTTPQPGSGQAGSAYSYANYVDVPFQVWDITNNRQLMVSFRDQMNDGAFDLSQYPFEGYWREYLFINSVLYNPAAPDPSIAKTAGMKYKNIYCLSPMLAPGGTWNPQTLPEGYLRIKVGTLGSIGRSVTKLTHWYRGAGYAYVHADQHNLIAIPMSSNSFRLLNGSDGGVAVSDDGGVNWTNPNNTYNTSQFYGVDKKHGASIYIGGTQDNGTWVSGVNPNAGSTNWINPLGGDGFEVAWNYNDGNKIIGSLYYNDFYRSLTGGGTFTRAVTDLSDNGSGKGPFITRIAKTNSDPELLFTVGVSGVSRSDNFADNWTLTKLPTATWRYSSPKIAISVANPQVVWAGSYLFSTGKLFVSTNSGLTFDSTGYYPSVDMGRISGLATHPRDEKTAYALFSFANKPKVLRTTDLGKTWQDISGFGTGSTSSNGFPNVATYCLLVMPHNPNEIWVGTDIGLFISTNNGASWSFSNDNLPATAIWKLIAIDDQVVAATHGRGIWSVTILETPPAAAIPTPRLNKPTQTAVGLLSVGMNLRAVYDSTAVFIDGQRAISFKQNAAGKDTTVQCPVMKNDSVIVNLISYKNGVAYYSGPRGIDALAARPAQASYQNDFDTTTMDFVANGFSLQKPSGFSTSAYHSLHPYGNNKNLTLSLAIPIIVQATNATLKFSEIVLIQPGAAGAKFGDPLFYDYVIVEGSKDGVTWVPIEDGYDSNRYAIWKQAYASSGVGDEELLQSHTMNLLTKFKTGDQIFIRFRLYSDASDNGWGWVIDNLEIQPDAVVAVENEKLHPATFSLSQNYPNPFNPSTLIRFSVPTESRVTLTIYDALGRKIETLADKILPSGYYSEQWQAKKYSSGIYYYRLEAVDQRSPSYSRFVETKKMVFIR